MKSILISDLHLSADQPEILQAFRQFLNELPKDIESLYILGDLFEAWIGDEDTSDFAVSVKDSLSQVTGRGINVKVQRGNRDFMLGTVFSKHTGAELLPDHYIFDSHGQKALLMHGDLLCTDDEAYQKFRKRVHHPIYNSLLKMMPLPLKRKIAKKWRAQSKEMNQNKPENIMDVNLNSVEKTLFTYQTDTLIHGHTHRPNVHNMDNGQRRIVLGDWGTKLWWIEATSAGFELLSKPIHQQV